MFSAGASGDDWESRTSLLRPVDFDVSSYRWLRSHPRSDRLGSGAYGDVFEHVRFPRVRRALLARLV